MVYYDRIINVYKKVCDKCGQEFNFREDHILHMGDWSEAFQGIWVESILCPNCHHRNILGSRLVDGVERKADYKLDEVATRALNA